MCACVCVYVCVCGVPSNNVSWNIKFLLFILLFIRLHFFSCFNEFCGLSVNHRHHHYHCALHIEMQGVTEKLKKSKMECSKIPPKWIKSAVILWIFFLYILREKLLLQLIFHAFMYYTLFTHAETHTHVQHLSHIWKND